MKYDPLVYGKSGLEKIVGLEPGDDFAEVFIESSPGVITSQFVPNRYWILSSKPYDKSWVRLKGNQHFKYGKQFATREEFQNRRNVLKKQDVFSIYDAQEALMVKDGYTYFKGIHPKDISVLSFDLETTGLNPEAEDALVILISITYRAGDKVVKRLLSYDDYESEVDMLLNFCSIVQELNPTVIIGHNIYSFDFPYIISRAEQLGITLELGRDKSKPVVFKYESDFRLDGSRDLHYKKIRIFGRQIIDTMFLAYKYDIGKKYESYGLKQIIRQEGLEKKDRVFYDASQIRFNYKNKDEMKKIKDYCRDDSDDALALYDLMITPFFYMAQVVPKSFQSIIESASGAQINSVMVRSYLQDKHSIAKASDIYHYEGGISLGIPGIYKNVFKIDVASLYPSVMLEYEVYDKEKDPNANFLKTLKYFTEERLRHKKLYKETGNKYHDDFQATWKIFINSYYGFMGTAGLNYNSIKCAEYVTKKGRDTLKYAIKWATGMSDEQINKLIEDNKNEE